MARKPKKQQAEQAAPSTNGKGMQALTKELWQAAVNLRGSIEPADYKRYVLPIIFLRYLSIRYERRRAELERLPIHPGEALRRAYLKEKAHCEAVYGVPSSGLIDLALHRPFCGIQCRPIRDG